MRYKPMAESADLFNVNFILRILLFGVLPSVWVAWQRSHFPHQAQHIAARLDVFAQPRFGGVTDFGDE